MRRITGLTAAVALLHAMPVDARQPTISDFAICNREAARVTGAAPLPPAAEAAAKETSDTGRSPDAGTAATPPVPSSGPGYRTEAGRTDPTGSLIVRPDDPLLRGMAANHADEQPFRAAYRDCMAGRGVAPDAGGTDRR